MQLVTELWIDTFATPGVRAAIKKMADCRTIPEIKIALRSKLGDQPA